MARPFFGNPEKADIVILKKHPEKDFNSYNTNLSDDTAIEYRKRIVLDIQGKLTFNNEKLFLPYICIIRKISIITIKIFFRMLF